MSRFFLADLSPHRSTIELSGAETHHLCTVLRAIPGQRVTLFSGDGREYVAELVEVAKRKARLRLVDSKVVDRELPGELQLACPIPKVDRQRWLVEKATELGVTAWVPLATQRTQPHAHQVKQERLDRYVIEASKQCGRNRLMDVGTLTPWKDYLRSLEDWPCKLLADPGGIPLDLTGCLTGEEERVAVTVGPEGGWTADELSAAQTHGWTRVRLSNRTLRMETAALVLASVIGAAWVGRSKNTD